MSNPRNLAAWLVMFACLGAGSVTGEEQKKKSPVPDEAARAKSLSEVKSVLADDFDKLPKAELARKLLTIGSGASNDASHRYVLLTEAAKASMAAGDGALVIESVDMLAEHYDGVNAAELKLHGLERTAESIPKGDAESMEGLARFVLDYTGRLMEADSYDAAQRLNKASLSLINRMPNKKEPSKEGRDQLKKNQSQQKQILALQRQIEDLKNQSRQAIIAQTQLPRSGEVILHGSDAAQSAQASAINSRRAALRVVIRDLNIRLGQAQEALARLQQSPENANNVAPVEVPKDTQKQVKEELLKQAKGQQNQIKTLKRDFEEVAVALAQLEKKPGDRDANLTAGKYYALAKGNWDKGVPMLALGSNPDLKAAAVLDLSLPEKSSSQVDLADKWWDLSTKANGDAAVRLRQRAALWYSKALPEVQDEFIKAKVQKRLDALSK